MYQELHLKSYYKWIGLFIAAILLILVCGILFLWLILNHPDVRAAFAILPTELTQGSLFLNLKFWNIVLPLMCAYPGWILVKLIDGNFTNKPYAIIRPDRIDINETNVLFFFKGGSLHWNNIEEILPHLPNTFDHTVIIKLRDPTKFRKQTFNEKLIGICLKIFTLGKYKKNFYSDKLFLATTQEMSAPELRDLISNLSGVKPDVNTKQFKQIKGQQSLTQLYGVACLLVVIVTFNYDTIVSYLPDRKITSVTLDIKALAEHGDPDAQTKLGWRYSHGYEASQNSKAAVHWWKQAAAQGWTKAEYNMGWAYSRGRGVKRNYKEAFKWYSRAAAKEFALAESSLGYLYSNGKGVKKDYGKAFEWRLKAAERGDLTAQGSLGWHYAKGKGVKKDYTEALKWFQTAAKEGHTYSESWLGWMYEKGNGVPKSREKALMYYERAAAKNYKYAIKRLKRLKG